ncbi:hypothetical protein TNIN_416141 [Trichonephila inaurata madagascariensis]|uniref:Uncharacterized protein n=1 Tax=Trichonephila inaurata madagascariensis TaxID=2747483 RepID=A0A8X6XD25_9ARAC|nr:hypothetical protein TNIN_416141 [Trichonephila inaurata madagascariensis]
MFMGVIAAAEQRVQSSRVPRISHPSAGQLNPQALIIVKGLKLQYGHFANRVNSLPLKCYSIQILPSPLMPSNRLCKVAYVGSRFISLDYCLGLIRLSPAGKMRVCDLV